VYTNEGLTGLGEGSITSKEATLAQAIMEHERFLVGKDPTDIELLWQAMFRYPRWRGGPILNSAISAVDGRPHCRPTDQRRGAARIAPDRRRAAGRGPAGCGRGGHVAIP